MRIGIYFIIITILTTGCYTDFDNTFTETEREQTEIIIETGLTGRIQVSGNQSIEEYHLSINGNNYNLVDNSFYFYLFEAYKKGQLIELYKGENLRGIANVMLIENDINYVEIIEFPISTKTQKENSTSNKLTLGNGISLDFLADAFVTSEKDVYSGNVNLNHTLITNKEQLSQLGQYAINSSGQPLVINSSAAFFLEFASDSGTLELAANKANLSITNSDYIGQSLFRLNSFGELQLIVENISSSELINLSTGGLYLFANYDLGVYSEGSITHESNPVSYMTFLSGEYRKFSTANGKWAAVFPAVNDINLQVLSPCQDFLQETQLSIGDEEYFDYKVMLNTDFDLIYQIVTKVINCEGEIEEVQAIKVSTDNNDFIYVFNQGIINTWIPICKNEFSIAGVEITDFDSGPVLNWSFDFNDEITFISSCHELEKGFGFVVINNEQKLYESFNLETENGVTSLKSEFHELRIHFNGLNIGDYNVEDVRIFINDPSFGSNGYSIACENSSFGCGIEKFVVTHFESVSDGWFRVNFSGVLWAQTISPAIAGNYPIEGTILTKIN